MAKPLPARGRDFSSNSPDWFENVYNSHVDMLCRVSYSYIKNTHDSDDIVVDVFLKLLEKRIEFKNAEHEKAWLLRTTVNLCKDRLKHWWRRRKDIDDYRNLAADNRFEDDEILKIVLDLPERYKAVIYLYYYEGYSSEEIADILKKPRSTVLNHLSEARNILKGVLEDEKQ